MADVASGRQLLSMDKLMQASFGETSNKLSASFKKTILMRDYETEVIEANTSIEIPGELSGIERIFIQSLLEVQLEYQVYVSLFTKKLVTQTQFNERKSNLEMQIYSIQCKADEIIGRGKIDKYIEYTDLASVSISG